LRTRPWPICSATWRSQGAEFPRGPIALWRRGLFFLSVGCLMFPTSWLLDVLGLGVMAAAWSASFLPQAASGRTDA
jgi:hypothetical protein